MHGPWRHGDCRVFRHEPSLSSTGVSRPVLESLSGPYISITSRRTFVSSKPHPTLHPALSRASRRPRDRRHPEREPRSARGPAGQAGTASGHKCRAPNMRRPWALSPRPVRVSRRGLPQRHVKKRQPVREADGRVLRSASQLVCSEARSRGKSTGAIPAGSPPSGGETHSSRIPRAGPDQSRRWRACGARGCPGVGPHARHSTNSYVLSPLLASDAGPRRPPSGPRFILRGARAENQSLSRTISILGRFMFSKRHPHHHAHSVLRNRLIARRRSSGLPVRKQPRHPPTSILCSKSQLQRRTGRYRRQRPRRPLPEAQDVTRRAVRALVPKDCLDFSTLDLPLIEHSFQHRVGLWRQRSDTDLFLCPDQDAVAQPVRPHQAFQ